MKKINIKIIIITLAFISSVSFTGMAYAAESSLYVSPATMTTTVGGNINASIGVETSGNKVCAVEGTIVFDNLSCQSITISNGVTPQTLPTCSNPTFLVGIPNCSTSNKILFTISTKAQNTGTASLRITNVDVIGEGMSVGSASSNGSYIVKALPIEVTPPAPATAKIDTTETKEVVVDESSDTNTEIVTTENSDESDSGNLDNLAAISETEGEGIFNSPIMLNLLIAVLAFISGLFVGRKIK